MTLTRQNIMGIGLAAAVLTAVALAAANFVGTEPGANGGGIEYAVTLGGSLILALAIFGWVIPRSEHPARAGLVTGVIGVLSLAAFWSGLPYVLGPAAIALGLLGRARMETRTQGAVAVVLGALATVGGLAALVADQAM
jgi:hypothetical protein